MQKKSSFLPYFYPFVFIIFFFVSCCAPPDVNIGPPLDRYDHNRTKALIVRTNQGEKLSLVVVGELYAPQGMIKLFGLQIDEANPSLDSLPAANFLPIFTGIPLPLEDTAFEGTRSDRRDLVDFLAAGRSAHSGVEAGDAQGDLSEAEKLYGPILDLMSRKELLSESKDILMARLLKLGVRKGGQVYDGRYQHQAFGHILAFGFADYWFVLYRVLGGSFYSRLVVVPKGG